MSLFASMIDKNWPVMLTSHGQSSVYTSANGTTTTLTVIATGKPEALSLDDTWETAARQIEVHAAVSDAPATFTPREDTITLNGIVYTVLERADIGTGVYRYLCERKEIDAIALRSRRW
jgi:hypothetical protein